MIGGELEQMQSLKASLDRHGVQVGEVAGAIRAQIAATFWKGPAADRFRQMWGDDFEPALRRLQEALGEAAQEVQRRHDALQQAGS
ncbi:MAG TPA: WXG100 family type VII secretion target [Candidatus Dormibacteraeota bacterium]|jgi:WXG100 family type VII secretion target|nr:WXG100 family type VII secretion target [Candidatus Dormibacteraeota bacterium]